MTKVYAVIFANILVLKPSARSSNIFFWIFAIITYICNMFNINYKTLTFIASSVALILMMYLLRDANITLNKAQHAIDKVAHDRKVAMDSIAVLNQKNDSLNQSIAIYKDSLTAIIKYKSKVIIKYRDQKKFVNDADIDQLDSIIRANTTIGF